MWLGFTMPFSPVTTKAELETFSEADVLEGYLSAERSDPEPGENRGKGFWHGWRNRMIDLGELPSDGSGVALIQDIKRNGGLRERWALG